MWQRSSLIKGPYHRACPRRTDQLSVLLASLDPGVSKEVTSNSSLEKNKALCLSFPFPDSTETLGSHTGLPTKTQGKGVQILRRESSNWQEGPCAMSRGHGCWKGYVQIIYQPRMPVSVEDELPRGAVPRTGLATGCCFFRAQKTWHPQEQQKHLTLLELH